MIDYIRRDEAIIAGMAVTLEGLNTPLKIRAKFDEIPAADVVELVRCKDCEMWGYTLSEEDRQRCIEFDIDLVCDYWESDGLMPNDYCSKGERKEGQR